MLNVSKLKAGDIMTFDGERDEQGNLDPLSHLIMILTDSEVSHGGLFIQENPPAMADAALSGLHAHLVADKGDPLRPVHICRLKMADQLDLTPVIEAAEKYLKDDLVYPMPDLILLGMILVYKNVSHVSLKQKVIIGLLKIITAKIKSILEDKKYEGKHPMICSEFVYQCYLDASKKDPRLKLILKNADLQLSLRHRTSITLLDHYIDYRFSQQKFFASNEEPIEKSLFENVNEDIEENESQLIQMAIKGIHDKDRLFGENESLSLAVQNFLIAEQELRGKPIHSFKSLIDNAKEQQAFFVTPNDLLCHISNADNLGKLDIYRDSNKLNLKWTL
jgi:hypothetical protein